MTDTATDKQPRIRKDEKLYPQMVKLRESIRWCFELLRNVAVIGAIQYLSIKTDNQFLFWISHAATFMLVAYFYSYIEQVTFDLFPQIKRRWLAATLEALILVVVVGVGGMSINVGIQRAVADVAAAYQVH